MGRVFMSLDVFIAVQENKSEILNSFFVFLTLFVINYLLLCLKKRIFHLLNTR